MGVIHILLRFRTWQVQGSNIFIGTSSGIFLSLNNGANWSTINTGLTNTTLDITGLVNVGSTVVAGIWEGGIFKSTNNGLTWVASNNGLQDSTIDVLASNGRDYIIASTNKGLFQSNDAGMTWNKVTTGTIIDSVFVNTMMIINTYLFIGTRGSGAWRYPL